MDIFGVQKRSLKKIALQPPIPSLITDPDLSNQSAAISFLGGLIKSVDGLEGRSAYELPDEFGIIIISTGTGSPLSKSGLQDKDVIRTANNQPVNNVKQLMEVFHQSLNQTDEIPLTIIWNQIAIKIVLRTK